MLPLHWQEDPKSLPNKFPTTPEVPTRTSKQFHLVHLDPRREPHPFLFHALQVPNGIYPDFCVQRKNDDDDENDVKNSIERKQELHVEAQIVIEFEKTTKKKDSSRRGYNDYAEANDEEGYR